MEAMKESNVDVTWAHNAATSIAARIELMHKNGTEQPLWLMNSLLRIDSCLAMGVSPEKYMTARSK